MYGYHTIIAMSTINISLPKSMYEDAKKTLKTKGYASISELIRDALRKILYEEDKNAITENGFPVWFEDKVLEAEKEPIENDVVLETKQDVKNFFKNLHQRVEKRRGKG